MSLSDLSQVSLRQFRARPGFRPRVGSMVENDSGRQARTAHPEARDAGNSTALSQRAALVQQFPVFSNISLADCREIVSTAYEKEFSRRQTISLQGDPVRQVLLLISGCVKVTQLGQNGTEVILRLSGPGEIVGATGLCLHRNHCSTARTIQPSKALIWDAAVFEAAAERFPILRRNAARILDERLRELEERFREISTEKVAPRLGHEIARLLRQVGQRVNGAVEINLSREELAQLTGTTLFTVCRLLSQWDELGIVKTRREAVIVHNIQALVDLSESE